MPNPTRKIQSGNLYRLFIITLIVISALSISQINTLAAPTIPPYLYISTEVGGGNNATLRNLVDTQDDTWRADAVASGASSFTMVDFGTETNDGYGDIRPDMVGPYPPGNPITSPLTVPDGTYFSFPTVGGIDLTITLLNMDGSGDFGGTPASITATYPRITRSSTLQDGAPRPNSLYSSTEADRPRYWNETIGSGLNRNAILLQFSEPISAFGAWFGDVETRTDGSGTPAQVQLFNASNNMIEDQIIPTSTSNQSLCGDPVDPNYAGCGNETTRWTGFIDPNVQVSAMLVIVGDDDSTGDTLGLGESLSFIGATIAEGIQAPLPLPTEEPELPKTGFRPGETTHLNYFNKVEYQNIETMSLQIPNLNINAEIVGVPFEDNKWDVEWLGDKVGYLVGTSYPTWAGNTVLTGHVYNQYGEFGVFSDLEKLIYGDHMKVSAWGQEYIYEVRDTKIVYPENSHPLEEIEDGYDWLTLVTCKGYDQKNDAYQWRYIVRAVLVEINSQN